MKDSVAILSKELSEAFRNPCPKTGDGVDGKKKMANDKCDGLTDRLKEE